MEEQKWDAVNALVDIDTVNQVYHDLLEKVDHNTRFLTVETIVRVNDEVTEGPVERIALDLWRSLEQKGGFSRYDQ